MLEVKDIVKEAIENPNDPLFGKFEPKNKTKLRSFFSSKDLTLYPCKRMNARLTARACALHQYYGREECSTCKKPITEIVGG